MAPSSTAISTAISQELGPLARLLEAAVKFLLPSPPIDLQYGQNGMTILYVPRALLSPPPKTPLMSGRERQWGADGRWAGCGGEVPGRCHGWSRTRTIHSTIHRTFRAR